MPEASLNGGEWWGPHVAFTPIAYASQVILARLNLLPLSLLCRSYSSNDPLDLGEACWLAHWALPEEPWAQLVSEVSVQWAGCLPRRSH